MHRARTHKLRLTVCLIFQCCVVALVQWGVQLRKRNATLLVDNETDDGLLDPEQNKSAISLA